MPTENTQAECQECGVSVWWYIHSQAGPIKAGAWTDIAPDDETDPRYGTYCEQTKRHHVVNVEIPNHESEEQ